MNVVFDVKTLKIGSLQQASTIRIGVTQLEDGGDEADGEEVPADGMDCLVDQSDTGEQAPRNELQTDNGLEGIKE